MARGLSEQEMAELCALADGTLPAERRAAVEARVAASPALQELLERQRRAVTATRVLADEPVPPSLRAAVEAGRRPREHRRGPRLRPVPRVAVAGALAAAVAAVLAVVLTGGPGAPTVAAAARIAGRPATGPAPPALDASGTKLALDVEGVAFPNLARSFGWRPVGVRRDELDGREATVVFYAKDARRVAYVIVGGSSLPRPSAAEETTRGGVLFQTLRVNGRQAVTWRRAAHTCVLIGAATRDELLALANWRGEGTLRY
jgi:anti-sigma factor RsiW